MNRVLRALLVVLGVVVLLTGSGCGDDKKGGLFGDSPPTPPPPDRGGAPKAAASDGAADAGAPKVVFREEDFVETEMSRDPFRSFIKTFADEDKSGAKTQREVLLEEYSIDDLDLVGIVTGTAEHRAMVLDPHGTGWIIRRGQFIGKAELVRGSGASSASYELNWRVDRIRDGDVVLVREDPAHSDIPPATRVIALHPDAGV